MSIKNIGNWTKNMQSFPQFDNVYSSGRNTLTYTGGGGYERLYYPVQAVKGARLVFKLKFCSPTGFSCGYGDSKEYIAIFANEPTNNALYDNNVLAKTALFSGQSHTLEEYTVSIIPTSSTTVYLVIDFGYMIDGVTVELIYADISAETEYDWNIIDGQITNENFIPMPELYDTLPDALWRTEDNNLFNKLMSQNTYLGAFANATQLRRISIPKSCKKIGRYSFRNTKLTAVTIASDCVYYDTSFPAGCVVNFYPD